MPREVDGLTDDIDELVDYQLTDSPAALKRHVASPVVASAGRATPHNKGDTMSAELDGARQNAEFVHKVAHPRSQLDMLATQHLEKNQ